MHIFLFVFLFKDDFFIDFFLFFANLNEKDKIRISFIHPSLVPSINLPFMTKDVVTPENLLAIFERVSQSKKTIKLNETNNLRVDVIIARLPAGSGRKIVPENEKARYIKIKDRPKLDNLNYFERWCASKACVKLIFNSDRNSLIFPQNNNVKYNTRRRYSTRIKVLIIQFYKI